MERHDHRARAVLLDAGGTLFRESPTRYEVYAAAARARGLRVDDEEMKRRMGEAHDLLPREIDGHFRYTEPWFRSFIEVVFSGLGFRGDWGGLFSELFATFRDGAMFHPFDDARALLARLRGARVPVAVVSNWSPPLPRILAAIGLARHVDVIVTSAVVRLEKPEPAIFRRAADALSVPIDACLHVGDRVDLDLDGARSAGADARLIDREGRRPDLSDRVASLEEIFPLVGR
ncbi:MAG: HAD family hydrolase [Planctomycetota bacterium JB042]